MKLSEMTKSIFKTKVGKIIILALIAAVLVSAAVILKKTGKQTIDTSYLTSAIEKSSELTTVKLKYTGMSKFEDGGVPFINKSNFSMIYKATARAGIDVKKITVEADNSNRKVYIKIPKSEVLDVKVEPESIEFLDTKFALFNFNEKENAVKALALAEEEAKKEVANMGILKMADEQAEALVKGLIQDAIPKDCTIEIKR